VELNQKSLDIFESNWKPREVQSRILDINISLLYTESTKEIYSPINTFCGMGLTLANSCASNNSTVRLGQSQVSSEGHANVYCLTGGWLGGLFSGEVKGQGGWLDCRAHFSAASRLLIGAKINWKCWSIASPAAQLQWRWVNCDEVEVLRNLL